MVGVVVARFPRGLDVAAVVADAGRPDEVVGRLLHRGPEARRLVVGVPARVVDGHHRVGHGALDRAGDVRGELAELVVGEGARLGGGGVLDEVPLEQPDQRLRAPDGVGLLRVVRVELDDLGAVGLDQRGAAGGQVGAVRGGVLVGQAVGVAVKADQVGVVDRDQRRRRRPGSSASCTREQLENVPSDGRRARSRRRRAGGSCTRPSEPEPLGFCRPQPKVHPNGFWFDAGAPVQVIGAPPVPAVPAVPVVPAAPVVPAVPVVPPRPRCAGGAGGAGGAAAPRGAGRACRAGRAGGRRWCLPRRGAVRSRRAVGSGGCRSSRPRRCPWFRPGLRCHPPSPVSRPGCPEHEAIPQHATISVRGKAVSRISERALRMGPPGA